MSHDILPPDDIPQVRPPANLVRCPTLKNWTNIFYQHWDVKDKCVSANNIFFVLTFPQIVKQRASPEGLQIGERTKKSGDMFTIYVFPPFSPYYIPYPSGNLT